MKTYIVVVDSETTDEAGRAGLSDALATEVTGHGGRYLSRGGAVSVVGGDLAAENVTLIEFDNPGQVKALLESQRFIELRKQRSQFVKASPCTIEGG